MTLSMYTASIPALISMLSNLAKLLEQASTHTEAKKIEPNALLQARLFPDMFALTRQVQIASDQAKGAAARLAGIEVPKFEDQETTFPQLQERIAQTIAFLKSIRPEQLENSETRDIVLQVGEKKFEFKGQQYLTYWVLPNFYFHVTTAYNILRHNGVEIGKRDFLGG